MRLVPVVLLSLAVTSCKGPEAPAAAAATAEAPSPGSTAVRGKLVERIDAPPYSYLRLAAATGEIWAAVPQTTAATGADVVVENPLVMEHFESKSLNRKFDQVVFGTLAGPGAAAAGAPVAQLPAGHGAPIAAPAAAADVADVKVAKAAGANAKTIAEVYGQKAALKESKVAVRGKVVKANSGILGKNWFHLRDGSGAQASGDNDLTVTSDAEIAVGDVVEITGVVRLDRDFGAGYAYPVIIEEAVLAK
ncbi:MAG: nucleotide-binding protein [Deltaproteobacteria bacterium]|nr:nucleotide-binding protein [Deltaproteobacteria bacterium]